MPLHIYFSNKLVNYISSLDDFWNKFITQWKSLSEPLNYMGLKSVEVSDGKMYCMYPNRIWSPDCPNMHGYTATFSSVS